MDIDWSEQNKKKNSSLHIFILFVSGNQVNLITFSMGAASEEDFDIHNQKAIFWADSRSLKKKKLFQLPDMALCIKISYMTVTESSITVESSWFVRIHWWWW